MSRSLLHDWEPSIENLSVEMSKIAEDIYNTAYARGKNHSDVTEVLDKIRAEIEQHRYGLVNDGLDIALNIIDKYKAETEAEDGND